MRIVRFLYCLCALLITGAAHSPVAVAAAGSEHPFQTSFVSSVQAPAESGHLIMQAEQDEPHIQYFFADESEDEDSDELRDGHFSLPGLPYSDRSYPSYATILRHPGNCFQGATAPVVLSEAKYILLGVLRI